MRMIKNIKRIIVVGHSGHSWRLCNVAANSIIVEPKRALLLGEG